MCRHAPSLTHSRVQEGGEAAAAACGAGAAFVPVFGSRPRPPAPGSVKFQPLKKVGDGFNWRGPAPENRSSDAFL